MSFHAPFSPQVFWQAPSLELWFWKQSMNKENDNKASWCVGCKASLGYIESWKVAWVTWNCCLKAKYMCVWLCVRTYTHVIKIKFKNQNVLDNLYCQPQAKIPYILSSWSILKGWTALCLSGQKQTNNNKILKISFWAKNNCH